MNRNPKTIKKGVVALVTIIMLLIIVVCVGLVLYYNKLLPQGLREYIDSLIYDSRLANGESVEVIDKDFYEIQYELELPDYNQIEIIDIANSDTMLFGTFSKEVVDKVSILKADDKFGLISNEDGKILVEPQYQAFEKDISNQVDTIYGVKDGKYEEINLKTFKVKKDIEVPGHGGCSKYYYDSKKGVIWLQEFENIAQYQKNDEITKKYEDLGTTYAICILQKQKEPTDNNSKILYGMFDLSTGLIKIEPMYEKITLFQDGVAGVRRDGKGYFISEINARISDEYFEDVSGMHNFKAWIKLDGKWKLAYFPSMVERKQIYDSNKEAQNEKIVYNSTENVVVNSVDNTVTNTTNTVTNTVSNETNDKNIIGQ